MLLLHCSLLLLLSGLLRAKNHRERKHECRHCDEPCAVASHLGTIGASLRRRNTNATLWIAFAMETIYVDGYEIYSDHDASTGEFTAIAEAVAETEVSHDHKSRSHRRISGVERTD